MKITTSKEWFASRAASEEGKSIEAGSLHRDCCAARRAQKILREITRSMKLKQRMVKRLGMTPQQASAECGDEIY